MAGNANPLGMPDSVSGKIPIEQEKPTGLGTPSTFETYMQGTAAGPKGMGAPPTAPLPQGPSPMELSRPAGATGAPTFDSLLVQSKNAQDGLGTIEQQLKDPNLKLKRSQSQLLKHKLQDANDNMRYTGDKLGLSQPPPREVSGGGPIARFLGMIGQGQDEMMQVQSQIKEMSKTPDAMRPGDMMLIQIKMSNAQQAIEFSSTMLSKVIDSFRQLFNIQL